MAYSFCHAPLELEVSCFLEFIQSKNLISSILQFIQNNLILCFMCCKVDSFLEAFCPSEKPTGRHKKVNGEIWVVGIGR